MSYHRLRKIKKRGAIELSIGTIVIIVLAMAMLILGLVLVRTIFKSSIYNVKEINDKVREEIGKIFGEDENRKTVIFLAEQKAEVRQGEDWGVAFAIRNTETGTTQSSTFAYNVVAADLSVDCVGLSKTEAERWIKARKSGTITIGPGDASYIIIRFSVPENAPLCVVPYDIKVTRNQLDYTTDSFDLIVKS